MRILRVLLVGLTIACGVASSTTVNLRVAFADDSSNGY